VVVLDSGIGKHPWLTRSHVTREPEVLGAPIGIPSAPGGGESSGSGDRFTGELDPDAGHGTFIAGLVRQACPDAHILGVRLFHGDGDVTEAHLLKALQLLALRHLLALEGRGPDDRDAPYEPVDVLSLSLGYYHEQPEDASFDPLLRGPLDLLGGYGVCTVVAAGNDATNRPNYPAAFAPRDGLGDRTRVPVVAVGALNPDGTVALFSNDGPWVRFWRPGASLVSTMPTTFDGSEAARNVLVNDRGETRAGLDPDDFTAGFGVWSGTSFAAPVFAGELAHRLLEDMVQNRRGSTPAQVVQRTRAVLATMPAIGARP
jgi:subtilisin family serine protease